MIILLYFLAGLIIGFFVTFTFLRNDKKYKALEESLQSKTLELENYQQQVTEHFAQTTKLLTDLQLQQDRVIAHLADGAAKLRYDMLDPVSELAIKGPNSYAPKDYPEAPPEDAKANDA